MEFVIPQEAADLLAQDTPTAFVVQDEVDIQSMSSANVQLVVEDATTALKKDCLRITTNDVFDPLFAISRCFVDVADKTKASFFQTCLRALVAASEEASKLSSSDGTDTHDDDDEDDEEAEMTEAQAEGSSKDRCRNAIKMATYLLSTCAAIEEGNAAKATKHLSSKTSAAKADFDWSSFRREYLACILKVVSCPEVPRLWNMACPEEPFVGMLTRPIYLMYENPVFVKDGEALKTTSHIIGYLVKLYNHALGASTSIVHLLPLFEYLPTPMAELVETIAVDFESDRVAQNVVREIGSIESVDLSKDASGARCYSAFLVELSRRIPKALLSSLAMLTGHLDGENYSMRNAILSCMANIIVLHLKDEQSAGASEARDQLLDVLEERAVDVSAYVRSKDMALWQYLANEKALPVSRLQSVAESAAVRAEDKSSMVRKQAIVLINALMQTNPFGDKLSTTQLEKALKEAQSKLDAALPAEMKEAEAQKDSQDTSEKTDTVDKATGDADKPQETDEQKSTTDELAEDAAVSAEPGAAEEGDAQDQSEESAEVKKLRLMCQFFEDALGFASAMETAIETIAPLLGSKNNSDVTESISCIVTASLFGVRTAKIGTRKMLALIWSREESIRQAVLDAYSKLYFSPDAAMHDSPKAKAAFIVKNLIALTKNANLGDLTSLEELVAIMMKKGVISKLVIQQLWDIFSNKIQGVAPELRRRSLVVLSMAAGADPGIVRDNVGLIVSTVTNDLASDSLLAVRDGCVALQKLTPKYAKGTKIEDQLPVRLSGETSFFADLIKAVTLNFKKSSVSSWMPAAEQVINTVYALSEHPDRLSGGFLREISQQAFGEPSAGVSSTQLARLVFVVGHIALKQLVHTEFVQLEMKRRRTIEEDAQVKERRKGQKTRKTADHDSEDEAEEMGVGGASADDVEADFMNTVLEQELVTPKTLVGAYAPLVTAICVNPEKFGGNDVGLQTAALSTLTKFMAVSSSFCEEHLQILFSILAKSPHTRVRCNAIIALGDLAFRFPNLIEPWTAHLYARLGDEDSDVRKNAVMVLTHLILNDMVKVKGQIAAIAICLEDPVTRIADLSRLFFHELANKGNAIYNILPDVISQVAEPSNGVSDDSFRNIMSYLFAFIKKDRQAESLLEKLCHRFRTTQDVVQWRKFAYCMTLLSCSERGVKKLTEQFACYGDKLRDEEVYQHFSEVLSKAKKFAKPETKEAITDLEEKFAKCHSQGVEEDEVAAKASKASKRAGKTSRASAQAAANGSKNQSKVSARRRQQLQEVESSSEESEDDGEPPALDDSSSGEQEEASPAPRAASKRQRRAKVTDDADVLASSDDENAAPNRKTAATKKVATKRKPTSRAGTSSQRRMAELSDEEDDLLI